MKIEFSKISKLEEKDVELINSFIVDFFPYVNYSKELICDKIKSNNFFIIKHHQKNIITGFAELEFLPEKKARLNAVFVEEAWRVQGIGTKLMKAIIHECKRKRIKNIFLLVKESNFGAKALYKKRKFSFKKMHDKKLDNSNVEVWERQIN